MRLAAYDLFLAARGNYDPSAAGIVMETQPLLVDPIIELHSFDGFARMLKTDVFVVKALI